MEHKTASHKQEQTQPKSFNIKFEKKKDADEGHTRFKRAAHAVQDMILLEHFSSNREEDWMKRKEAGVTIWINKNTGEVATIQPWVSSGDSGSSGFHVPGAANMFAAAVSVSRRMSNAPSSSSNAVTTGTGAAIADAKPRISTRPNTVDFHSDSKSPTSFAHSHDDSKRGGGSGEDSSGDSKAEPATVEFLDDDDINVELGTGALVYDRSEVDSFFAMLDGLDAK